MLDNEVPIRGDRLFDPEAASEEPEIGDAGRGGRVQKNLADALAEEAAKHPGKPIKVFATDEHRIGLKPITRRSASVRSRLAIIGSTGSMSRRSHRPPPARLSGISPTAYRSRFSKPCARSRRRRWTHHPARARRGAAALKIPDGIRLVYLPPYTPELQPAETLWALVDEPIVNKHIATIEDLEETIANQCVALAEQREQIQSRTGFHWWPKPIKPH